MFQRVLNFFSVVIFVLVSSCDQEEIKCCSCLISEGQSDAYVYPLVPGMPEWADLKTGEEIYAATQIPSNILSNMCTIGLVDSWLNYPLVSNLLAWRTFQLGFDKLSDLFNGLNELLNRSDAGEILLSKYKAYDPGGYDPSWGDLDKGRYSLNLFFLELTLAQEEIHNTLTLDQKYELVSEALEKHYKRLNHADIYSQLALKADAYIMTHIMISEGYEPFIHLVNTDAEIKYFVESCVYLIPAESTNYFEDMDKIIFSATQFLLTSN